MRRHLGVLLISLIFSACQASRESGGGLPLSDSPFGGGGGGSGSASGRFGGSDGTVAADFSGVQDALRKTAEETGDSSGALTGASQALGKLEDALEGLNGLESGSVSPATLSSLLSQANGAVCAAGVSLFRAGYGEISAGFFSLCDTKWIFEARIRRNGEFVRDTQTDDLTELQRLIDKWGYEIAGPVYRVYRTTRPYEAEPPEIASVFFPSRLKPLFRCWHSVKNYYFMTTDRGCEGAPQEANPPDPMGVRRLVGYVAAEASSGNRFALQRVRKLSIPNDLATIFQERADLYENLGYETLGVLGFTP